MPVYGAYEYAALAVRSALENTTHAEPTVLVVDDASPGALEADGPLGAGWEELMAAIASAGPDNCWRHYYPTNGGLTRSWNFGLEMALLFQRDYCCVTNSDVVFAPGWDRDVLKALEAYDLVGPVTNAPGTGGDQYVGRYAVTYRKDDAPAAIAAVQAELHREQAGRVKESPLNGFCLVAKTATWHAHKHDPEHVFRPRNDVNSKGQPNPTPLMTLQEYELQGRWRAAGLRSAIALGSYVFHYRAVSRGDAHKRGDWVRLKG